MTTSPDLGTTAALLADLRTLVEIESPSHDVSALDESGAAVAAMIRSRTGRPAELIPTAAGPMVHWPATADPAVLVVGHHDTVFPLGTLDRRPFAVADGRATGPGVFDMKAGIVMAIHAVASLEAEQSDRVEMLWTPDEEVGSAASRSFIEERAAAAGHVLVLEPGQDGAVKIARKGVGTFVVTVTGKAAHAGLEPEKGINALLEAAHLAIEVAGLADSSRGTTVTPTVARAGTVENVVPAEATLTVDVRVTELDEARRIERAFAALAPHVAGATISVAGGVNRPPMPDGSAGPLLALAQEAARTVGIGELAGVAVGGGSDGNFTAALGIPTLDGLGAVGAGAHADHEYVEVDQLAPRTALLAELLRSIPT